MEPIRFLTNNTENNHSNHVTCRVDAIPRQKRKRLCQSLAAAIMSQMLPAPRSPPLSFALTTAPSRASHASWTTLAILRPNNHVPRTLRLLHPPSSATPAGELPIADLPCRCLPGRRSVRRRAVAFVAAADGAILQDTAATVLVLAGACALVFVSNYLSTENLISQSLSRKLVHIFSGILFVVSWPIFSTSADARYFASVVPLVNCLRLLITGLSLAPNERLINSVTREGDPRELLRGPLYYVLILVTCSLCFWRESPVGVISLAMMCGGDGVADIVGRRFGKIKIPYNKRKSWAGSFAMFASGFLISMGMLYYYTLLGYFHLDWAPAIIRVAVVSLLATVVESLPITDAVDDNISVPLATMVMASMAFK